MRNGQHEALLRGILDILSTLGDDFAERVRHAEISDARPGTRGYNNLCKFSDGIFMAVRQPKPESGTVHRGTNNVVTIGRGDEETYPTDEHYHFAWTLPDSQIPVVARNVAPWVVYGIVKLTLESPQARDSSFTRDQ